MIQGWEPWGGVKLILSKSRYADLNIGMKYRVSTDEFTNRNTPLPEQPSDLPMNYSGTLVTLIKYTQNILHVRNS